MKRANSSFTKELQIWIKAFISNLVALDYSKNTISNYQRHVMFFYDYATGDNGGVMNFNLKTIKPMHIVGFFSYLDEIRSKQGKDTLTSRTKMAYLSSLKSFFNFISENNDELLVFDYLFKGLKLKVKKSKKSELKFLSHSEIDRILKYLNTNNHKYKNYSSYRDSLLVKLMLRAGLRVSEALNLKLGDFNKNIDGFYEISILGKGGDYQKAFIKESSIKDEMGYFDKNLAPDELVFTTNRNTMLDRINAYQIINNIYSKCHIDKNKRGCHILRHSFAMGLLDNNSNIAIIQKALRHKSIETTMVYADATESMIKGELDKL